MIKEFLLRTSFKEAYTMFTDGIIVADRAGVASGSQNLKKINFNLNFFKLTFHL